MAMHWMLKRRKGVFTVGRVWHKRTWQPQVWFATRALDGEMVWLCQHRDGSLRMTQERARGVTALGHMHFELRCSGSKVTSVKVGKLVSKPRGAAEAARGMVQSLLLEEGRAVSTDVAAAADEFINAQLRPLWRNRRRRLANQS